MMAHFLIKLKKGVEIEFLKIRRTTLFRFAYLLPASIPFFIFLLFFFRHWNFLPKEGDNIWRSYITSVFGLAAALLWPIYVIVSVSLNQAIEDKSKIWKNLFTLPVGRMFIFQSKVLFFILQLTVGMLIILLMLLGFGFLLGFLRPDLKFLEHSIPMDLLLNGALGLYLSVFGILGLQYLFCQLVRNTAINVTIPSLLLFMSFILVKRLESLDKSPFLYANIFLDNYSGAPETFRWLSYDGPIVLSLGLFAVFISAASYVFKQMKIN